MKLCPHCNKNNVIMFDADNDYCKDCKKYFPAVKDFEVESVILKIPEGYSIYHMRADVDKPFITFITPENEEIRMDMPKQIAYYLTTHFCGSDKMRKNNIEMGREQVRNEIRNILGI